MIIRKTMTFTQRLEKACYIAQVLAQGPEAFMIYIDMHWNKDEDQTKIMFATKLILDSLNMPIEETLQKDQLLELIKTLGNLALKYHMITISGAIKIVRILRRWLVSCPIEKINDLYYASELSIAIAKLLSRAKFAKAYEFHVKANERKQIEILREI